MLLSSSQVSALITTFIIISCTTALFLSGYVLQQRTVSQLRAAIRQHPLNPSPRPNLPDRFRSTTTELDDGTIIVLESEAQAEANQRDPVILNPDPSAEDQKPISLAQRRRLIKEELFRLSHDDKPVHYQRRLH
ncbi:hypothetical protein VdG1_04267 [Verticillium dahliae VDG1]|nr:hypothetical protein VdG1_04267 [Verticillium dahliae VDG1]